MSFAAAFSLVVRWQAGWYYREEGKGLLCEAVALILLPIYKTLTAKI